ncbi:putative Monocarboxylate transporter [Seiridium cardinale]|uniref:Monocarboxylate transporter n=1 Tax=Seiridium cardinale TaxID=138064 RepID=A0ABR2XG60_9PEZI
MRVKPAKPRDILDWSAFTNWPYAVFTLFYLVPILNAASALGPTVPKYLLGKFDRMGLFSPAAMICAILTFSMVAFRTLVGVTVVSLLFGFLSDVFLALPLACFG